MLPELGGRSDNLTTVTIVKYDNVVALCNSDIVEVEDIRGNGGILLWVELEEPAINTFVALPIGKYAKRKS